MAQQTSIELIDDLDGTQAVSTVPFALDGVTYDIDLSDKNRDRLYTALAEFVEHARRTGGRKRPTSLIGSNGNGRAPTGTTDQNRAIRDWAQTNGYNLGDRGRIPAEIKVAFEEAHAPAPAEKPARKSAATRTRKATTAKAGPKTTVKVA